MSKALDLVRLLINGANEYEKETGNKNPTVYLSRNNLLVIEKALLKAQEPKQYVDELKLVEKKLNALNLLMQELGCKDFAELRKYARCGYQTFRNAKGANYDNIIIDEAVIPSEALECLNCLERLHDCGVFNYEEMEDYNIIKQALLKAQKDRKALEIIKEKNVDIRWIEVCDTVKDYNKGRDEHLNYELTLEEFNLLKEVVE